MNEILAATSLGVATVTLNRPERLNAMTRPMLATYVATLRELDRDPEVKVIVVTGEGRGFCTGADLQSLEDISDSPSALPLERPMPTVPLELRKPVVAAINGPAVGLGFALMLACDVRFIQAGAELSPVFARLGLAAEYGISWLLPRIVGMARATEVLLSGRKIGSDEALRIGLVNESVSDVPVLARALEWSGEVAASCAPWSLATMKDQLYRDLDSSREDAIDRSVDLMVESFTRADLGEALSARQARRVPRFAPLD